MPVFRHQIVPETLGIDTLTGQEAERRHLCNVQQYIHRGNLDVSGQWLGRGTEVELKDWQTGGLKEEG